MGPLAWGDGYESAMFGGHKHRRRIIGAVLCVDESCWTYEAEPLDCVPLGLLWFLFWPCSWL
jgi:hypothetical protein